MVFISAPFPNYNIRKVKFHKDKEKRKGESKKDIQQSFRRWTLNKQGITYLLEQRKLKLSRSKVKERQASYCCRSLRDCKIISCAMNSLQGAKKPPDPSCSPLSMGPCLPQQSRKGGIFFSKTLKRQSSGTRDTSGEGSHGGECGTVVNVSLEREK